MNAIHYRRLEDITIQGHSYLSGPVEADTLPKAVLELMATDDTTHTVILIRDLPNRDNCGEVWQRALD